MLTEIYCESFGETKRVVFANGLNIVQGFNSNSIGKSNFLKIIEFAFGGQYYADSNDDVIKHIGDHDICFCHTFNNTPYYFRRNASNKHKVLCCNDNGYIPYKEISIDEFNKLLKDGYNLQQSDLSFRQTTGLYSRIWNKPNKEVNRPLYNYNSQTVSEAIITLVKLFNCYEPIRELNDEKEYLRKRSKALSQAVSYNIVKIPSKSDVKNIKLELSENENKILQLQQNIRVISIDRSDILSDHYNSLLEQRTMLLAQLSDIKRTLNRCEKNLKKIRPNLETSFSQLYEFFPDINIDRLKEINGFHEKLQVILLDELSKEELALKQKVENIQTALRKTDEDIKDYTNLPTKTDEAMTELQHLIHRQAQLNAQLELYRDKVTESQQKKENKLNLEQELDQILKEIECQINEKIETYGEYIKTSNGKAPILHLEPTQYKYGVEDNTGTGKAYTDLILFDLAILELTDLPILIHDSFLFNNIDDLTKKSFLKLYNTFSNKQVFISLDTFLGDDDKESDSILFSATRLFLSKQQPLYGKDWSS